MSKKDIILVGGGGHCISVIDVIEELEEFNIKGIVDINEKIGTKILGYPIIGDDNSLKDIVKETQYFHISMGFIKDPQKRIALYNFLVSIGAKLPKIISPKAYVSKHAVIGQGTIVMHFAQVNANSSIGNNCILNSKALIEHDAVIKSHCHISTGAIINGSVEVGEGCFIGSNATIVNDKKVSDFSFIKANQLF